MTKNLRKQDCLLSAEEWGFQPVRQVGRGRRAPFSESRNDRTDHTWAGTRAQGSENDGKGLETVVRAHYRKHSVQMKRKGPFFQQAGKQCYWVYSHQFLSSASLSTSHDFSPSPCHETWSQSIKPKSMAFLCTKVCATTIVVCPRRWCWQQPYVQYQKLWVGHC